MITKPDIPKSWSNYQGFSGLDIIRYDTDREAFLGPYRTYANRRSVVEGTPSNSMGYRDNPCRSLCGEFILDLGDTRSDCDSDSVLMHLKRDIQFSLMRSGIHGLPFG